MLQRILADEWDPNALCRNLSQSSPMIATILQALADPGVLETLLADAEATEAALPERFAIDLAPLLAEVFAGLIPDADALAAADALGPPPSCRHLGTPTSCRRVPERHPKSASAASASHTPGWKPALPVAGWKPGYPVAGWKPALPVAAISAMHGISGAEAPPRHRVGIVPPLHPYDGIETVAVTGFGLLDPGHGYFAEAEPVILDSREAIARRRRAAERQGPQPHEGHSVIDLRQ